MAYTLKIIRGHEIHRLPLEVPGGSEKLVPDYQSIDRAVRSIWPDVGAELAWYTSNNDGLYALEEPIFSDFLASAKEIGAGRHILKLTLPVRRRETSLEIAVAAENCREEGQVLSIEDSNHAVETFDSEVRNSTDQSSNIQDDVVDSPAFEQAIGENKHWICAACDEINKTQRQQCNNCGMPQQAAVPGAESLLTPSAPSFAELVQNQSIECPGRLGLFLTPRSLQRCRSSALLSRWLSKYRGIRAALPEYQAAAELICISPELMSSSRLWEHLKFIRNRVASVPPFEELILRIIHKAYNTRFLWTARFKAATIPGLGSGNLLQGAMQYYQALHWEKPYLVQALSLLEETETVDGLQTILGLMLSVQGWCHARKTWVFNTIISRVQVPAVAPSRSTPSGEIQALWVARQAVRELVSEFIEDVKDQALKTTFLEPTKMHFRMKDVPMRENQVDMHGANTYLAILAATLGVQLNRRPYLEDWAIGCADFLANNAPEPAAWAESHFGRDWEGIRELREEEGLESKPLRNPNLLDRIEFLADTCVLHNHSGFVFKGTTPREVANASVDPDGTKQQQRIHLAKYLVKFASWFSEDFILPRMVTRLIGETGRLEALQVLMDDLIAHEPHLAGDDGEEDVRFWLWNMSELPAQFQRERAVHLLRHAGVLRTPGIELPPIYVEPEIVWSNPFSRWHPGPESSTVE